MSDNNLLSFPDEEEDLEALRLAALQSLKKKSAQEIIVVGQIGGPRDNVGYFNGSPRGLSKRGKFSRSQPGRSLRNGQFNGWSRNSNLIAVPMVTEECNIETTPVEAPKLILPQDRYCKKETASEKSDGATSKFDRYDNSDDSESETEEEEEEKKPELKRSDSLEALMEELENEIQGVKSCEGKSKPKPKKKRKASTNLEPEIKPETVENEPVKENVKPEVEEVKPTATARKASPNPTFRQRKWQMKPRRHIAPLSAFPPQPSLPEIIPAVAFLAPPLPPGQNFTLYNPPPMVFDNGYVAPPLVFEAPPPQLPPLHVAPPIFDRPLSPLNINTDAYSTPTMAPLSPRSAAFVLENRAIVEKRKRRSYSRSPSPVRFRRSKSPKRLSLSPKRRSLSMSPPRKTQPLRASSPKRFATVHDRLGLKSAFKPDLVKQNEEKTVEVVDPIFEARRKKFQRNEISKAGVIKLKVKDEAVGDLKEDLKVSKEVKETKRKEEECNESVVEEIEEELDEDALLDDGDDSLVLDHKADCILFSDEESDTDNEGRFKTKQDYQDQKVAVLPFTKLVNGSKNDVKKDLKVENTRRNHKRKRPRSRSPARSPMKKIARAPVKNALDNRKIEIKIRNPSKYEKSDENMVESGRKIELPKKVEEGEKEKVGERLSEDVEEVPASIMSEGDLRAQLSRKRAERQKHPLPDVMPSRLLQNALQEVGFSKEKKAKNKDENGEGKLPIHLRLGAAKNSQSIGKKSRKRKNKGSQDQV